MRVHNECVVVVGVGIWSAWRGRVEMRFATEEMEEVRMSRFMEGMGAIATRRVLLAAMGEEVCCEQSQERL